MTRRGALLLAVLVVPAIGAGSGETAALRVAADRYMDADFSGAQKLIDQIEAPEPDDPWPALVRTNALLWQYEYQGEDPALEPRIRAAIDETVRRAKAATAEDANDPDAEFCWGVSLLHLARLAGTSESYVEAGARAKEGSAHVERARTLQPNVTDFRFGSGLYQYYSTKVPRALSLLGFLWFVPTGDEATGIAHLEEVAARGELLEPEAQATLLNVYLRQERGQLQRALELAHKLNTRYPLDLIFAFSGIEALFGLSQFDRALAEAKRAEAGGPPDKVYFGLVQIWHARVELELGHTEEALRQLGEISPKIAREPWIDTWAALARAQIADVRGDRAAAVALYQRVASGEGRSHNPPAIKLAEQGLAAPYSVRR
jgi:tetratricopeptide (TPR) repeat protein